MTISQLTATATATATFVQGPGEAAVDLTLVLPRHGSPSALRYVVERMCEALYAQCISFEMVAAISDAETGTGRWIGFLDVAEGAEIDAYGVIELLHQARDRAAA
ncbi:hypothetical protein [Actinoplanes palleronii]|uniref:Uncharacterized protein n=1 Tax=Actinoplanes palleronii TaxID=113570 RepID=A0ABQ4BF18_9ACTN|nr:hypothetical protein [Actinoplanes palleronii]GIE69268.1 hypothetical protein Apa02nite_053760 [Actinoplanes palleronii]